MSVKNATPLNMKKITLSIENDSHNFSLNHEQPSICNVYVKFHDNQSVHCWNIAFYKKDGGKLPSPTLQIITCVLTWRQPLDGATDRGVVRLGSQHHLCGSESVAYSSVSLRACWWRALWTSVVTATAIDIYRYTGSAMLYKCYWIVLYTVHVTACCLGAGDFLQTRCIYYLYVSHAGWQKCASNGPSMCPVIACDKHNILQE